MRSPERKARSDPLLALWLHFGVAAAVTAAAGWSLMDAAELIAERTALSETFVGTLLTAVFTSLPELVTTLAAIRYGALTLAFGNILGTNCLNVVVIGVARTGLESFLIGVIYPAPVVSLLFLE